MKQKRTMVPVTNRALRNFWKIMRLSVLFSFLFVAQAFATTAYSQQTLLTLKMQGAKVIDVLNKIENESEFYFLFNQKLLDTERQVNVDVKNESIGKILSIIFEKTNVTYLIKDHQIILATANISTVTDQGQQIMVTGKVTEASGAPLPGVSIVVKGTMIYTITDGDGKFVFNNIENSKILVFSFIGFKQQEVSVAMVNNSTVTMEEETKILDEVVVTGYTTQRKKDLTGSVAIVDVKNLKTQPTASVTEVLQGKAAGVNIVNDGSPGSTPQIRIRGYSTINNNDPLYIIDGVPYQGNLSWLNQNDIQSMQILKDASAASIYGSRANNGVIIITTKKGREGAPQITFDTYYGYSVPVRSTFPKFMTPVQFAEYRYQSYINAGLDPGASLGAMYGTGQKPVIPTYLIAGNVTGVKVTEADADPAKYNYNPSQFYQITRANQAGTDWMREITQNAPIQNYQLGASGGGKNATYALSLGYLDQKGIIKYTSFKKYTVRSNVQYSGFDNHLRFGTNLQFSRTEGIGFATNTSSAGNYQQVYSPVGNVYKIQTIIPVYDIMGNFAGARGATLGDAKNPMAILFRAKDNYTHENRLFGNVYGEVDIMKDLTFISSFGVNLNNQNGQTIRYPAMEDAVSIATNGYGAAQGYGVQWTWTNTVSYKLQFNKVNFLNLLVGTEAIKNKYRTLSGSRDGYFILGDLDYYYLNTGSTSISNAESGGRNTLASMFARADYSFNDKLLLSATIRRDGSSNFGADNLYAYFPAFSAAWRLSNEKFIKSISWITDLKIRAGYGETGNQNIPGNNAFDLYQPLNTTSYYAITGTNVLTSGISQNQIGNPSLMWEKLKSLNIGLDFTLLNGALDGSVDIYQKNTEGMLFPVSLPLQTAGMASSPFRNVGNMQNRGLEIVLNYHSPSTQEGGFTYDAGITFATNNNKIMKLAPGIDSSPYAAGGLTTTIFKVGMPYGEFYGYKQDGIFQNATEVTASTQPGARIGGIKYADANGDLMFSTDDRTALGSPLPKFTYGLNFNASYKNFDIMLFFYGSQGNKIYNVTKNFTDFQSFPSAASTRLLDAWSPTNTDSWVPSPSALASPLEYESSSYYVEDGSYFRLKNLQLGYDLKNIKIKNISGLRIYVSATNVFTLTKYSGLDPEVSQVSSTFSLPGIDLGVYPSPRQFLIGISARF